LGINDTFQKSIDKAFFRGKTSEASVRTTYILGNVIVMFLLFYVLLNTYALDLIASLHTGSSGISLLIPGLDDAIPFIPQSVIFYVYFFGALQILTMLYFAFIEYRKGYALGWSLVFIEVIAAVIYTIFPVSVYVYRQYILTQPIVGSFWKDQVDGILNYFGSTFNCFPSLHAAGSTICAYTWYRYSKVKPRNITKGVAVLAIASAICIIISTLLLKQHYIADEIAGIVIGWGVGRITFNRLWKSFKPAGFLPIEK
jgi:membrane-associated phospholipid phosphatase